MAEVEKKIVTLDEFCKMCKYAHWCGQRFHKGCQDFRRLPDAPKAFLQPLKQLRQVRRGPSVVVNKKVYYSKELGPYYGQKLLVKIDRLDPEHVFVFKTNGELVCECKKEQAVKALTMPDEDCNQTAS